MDDGYGEYVNKDLDQLKEEYVPVQLYVNPTTKSCTLGAGSRLLFWVVGDGSKTLFYLTAGWPVVLRNRDFSISSVVGAASTIVVDGRIKYTMPDDETWHDLGPILPKGHDPSTDPAFDYTRKTLLLSNAGHDVIAEMEIEKAGKSGELDDLFSMGGAFDE